MARNPATKCRTGTDQFAQQHLCDFPCVAFSSPTLDLTGAFSLDGIVAVSSWSRGDDPQQPPFCGCSGVATGVLASDAIFVSSIRNQLL